MIDHQIGDVAGVATDSVEYCSTGCDGGILFPEGGFEIVEQVEFEMVDNCRIELILTAFRVGRRRRTNCVPGSVEHHACGSDDAAAGASLGQVGIVNLKTQLLVQRAD